MTLIIGQSAKGKTKFVLGGTYISFDQLYGTWNKPMVAPLSPDLAWTNMNTNWKKGKQNRRTL